MQLDHFKTLTEDEQAAYLQSAEALETLSKDQEAEISSLKSENENYKAGTEKLESQLKEVKELNFTLARSLDTNKQRPTYEDTLHEAFYPKKGDR